MKKRKIVRICVVLTLVFRSLPHDACAEGAEAGSTVGRIVPSHADAAIIFAKYSGLFDRYIQDDAELDVCVSFLNKYGIYFGLLEVVDGVEFTLRDCARVMGQMNLLFSGEAEYQGGKVRLPSGMDSWVEFCILNDVKYIDGYKNLCDTTRILQALSE